METNKKIKVCHLTSVHGRYDIRIFEKECTSLANYGYDVYLLVNDKEDDEMKNNVKIVSSKFVPKNRIDRLLNSSKILYKKAAEINADIYHFHDPDLLFMGNKLRKKNKYVIFDSHEDVPTQIMDKEWIVKPIRKIISKIYEKIEKNIASKLDGIITVTPHIVNKFKQINENTIMVTNYPILSDEIKKKSVFNKKNSICFAGGISEQWMHENIIKAIEDIDNVEYNLAGNGSESYIEKLKNLNGWNKVNFYGKIPHDEVSKLYNNSTIGVAINYSSQAKEEGTLGNTKLFEIMQNGLPVICSNYKLWKEIIDKHECGICVDPNSIEEIKNAICYLVNNTEVSIKMGNRGREAVIKEYNWKNEEKKLYDMYDKMRVEING